MRRVPTSWVASGNPNSITDAVICFTQKFAKTRNCRPAGWHILQTFGRDRRVTAGPTRDGGADIPAIGGPIRAVGIVRGGCFRPVIRRGGSAGCVSVTILLVSASLASSLRRGCSGRWRLPCVADSRVSGVCNDGQTTESHYVRTREIFEYIFA